MRNLFLKTFNTQVSSQPQESSHSSSTASTQSPPPSPPHQPGETSSHAQDAASPALSDAETIEPEDYQPLSPPPPALNHRDDHSEASDSSTSTVPPPSPGALVRFQLVSDEPNTDIHAARVVHVDEKGIDALQRDEIEHADCEAESKQFVYPKLEKTKFRFMDEGEVTDLRLSDKGNDGILPKEIVKYLSKYQRDGVMFMYRLWERGRGGLLADAMGLGKTIQAVCFLASAFGGWDKGSRPQGRILVVAPASVGENWRKEIETWTPFKAVVFRSTEEALIGKAVTNGNVQVIIASDSVVGRNEKTWFDCPYGWQKASSASSRKQEAGKHLENKFQWDVVIVDEIHVAKCKTSLIYKALHRIPKRVMFGLTGTAVQNKLTELWNIMSLVVPAKYWINEKTFKKNFAHVISRGTKKEATPYLKQRAQDKIKNLRKILAKHMLRRPKSIIEDKLPGKTDWCVMMRMKKDGLQGHMYQTFQNSYDVKLVRDANEPCDCGSGNDSKSCCHRFPNTPENLQNAPIWSMHHRDGKPCEKCPHCISFSLQHYSRLLSAHALLILPEEIEQDEEKVAFRKRLFEYYLGDRKERAKEPITRLEQDSDVSCKLNVALRLLKSFEKEGHKTIIFYESLRLGEILRHWATRKRLMHEVIDGSVKKSERQGAVDRFNRDSVVPFFFISKRAGGTGLNICGADRVLIFEPCWNPTLDLQAGDRAHRLGQRRVVQIIRLVVENTVEHYAFKTAVSKSQLSSAILDNTKEEWHVRDDEIGNMNAMLRMGDVFANPEVSRDDFKMVEASSVAKSMKSEQFSSRRSKHEHVRDSLEVDELDAGVDVLGDSIIGSVKVDIAEDQDVNTLSGEREEIESKTVSRIPDSQFDTDMLLEEAGAAGKLVMTSTSARKKKRQLMGSNSTQREAGINPGEIGDINFDDASIDKFGLSQDNPNSDRDSRNITREVPSSIIASDQRRYGDDMQRSPIRNPKPSGADDNMILLSDESDDSIEVKKPRRRKRMRKEDEQVMLEKAIIAQRNRRKGYGRLGELRPSIQRGTTKETEHIQRSSLQPRQKRQKQNTTKPPARKPTQEIAAPRKSAFAARTRVRR